MTREDIKLYGEIFKELGLTQLKFTDKDSELILKKEVKVIERTSSQQITSVPNNDVEIFSAKSNKANETVSNDTIVAEADTDKGIDVKAPLVGIYYSSPSPDAEQFVKVGDVVNKGDVLCIIEAMKMFNEIKAETSGTVTEICVDNGNVVEYGQTIMRIKE